MGLQTRFCAVRYGLKWWLILLFAYESYGTQTDVLCLKEIKASLEDPYGYLNKTWDFTNKTEGAICGFIGIDCWQPNESRVLNIKLVDMGLKGQFPLGLEYCTSLTGLVLSGNRLSGPLPSNISRVVEYLTNLDLSQNDFSGEIPASLSNCTFLNTVNLGHNRFSGHIPLQLGSLQRMKSFIVANNDLSGPVPYFTVNIAADSYANNAGLCGGPLDACRARKSRLKYIVGGVGALIFVILISCIVLSLKRRKMVVRMSEMNDLEGDISTKTMKKAKTVEVIMFKNSDSVPELSMHDLIISTNTFKSENIISSGLTGKTYKATLSNGMLLMVKRLLDSNPTEDEFRSEMNTLGSLNHPNLLPLLGYCVWKEERFLVYEYMEKGSLYDRLHSSEPEAKIMEWPLRLKIAIGAARGLAWLHENPGLRLIHRCTSSKSILLDHDFEPKLHELCLSRFINPSQAHFSTLAKGEVGNLGYLAPEFTNVHRFGEVLLELITGEKPTEVEFAPDKFKRSLVGWVTQLLSTNTCNLDFLIDKSLLGMEVDDDELSQFLSLACQCVSPEPKERPTMLQVYQQLRDIGVKYQFMTMDVLI